MLACLAMVASAASRKASIKLGANWPLADVSGSSARRPPSWRWTSSTRPGGVLGRQLQLVVVDDEGKADKGVAAIEKLVTVDKADVLIGGIASGVALAQIPTIKKYRHRHRGYRRRGERDG